MGRHAVACSVMCIIYDLEATLPSIPKHLMGRSACRQAQVMQQQDILSSLLGAVRAHIPQQLEGQGRTDRELYYLCGQAHASYERGGRPGLRGLGAELGRHGRQDAPFRRL